jgi:hypothetical protein
MLQLRLPNSATAACLKRHYHSAVAFLAAVLLLTAGPSAEAVNPKYTAGVAAYNAKNFRAAAAAFADVVRAEPRNVSAAYYLGMSYFSLGQITAALGYFRWLADNYPATIEGRRAKSLIQRLGAQAAERGETLGSRPSGSGGTTGGARTAVSVPRPDRRASDDEPEIVVTNAAPSQISAESMIVMVKSRDDHPLVDETSVEIVKSALRGIPRNVLTYLYNRQVRVHVTATALDEDPRLAETQPRGYEQGSTFRNVPAFFDGRNVIVCVYAMRSGRNDWEPTYDLEGAVRHEVGHALDRLLGRLSKTGEFDNCYGYDRGKMEPEMQEQLKYYLQEGDGGPSECFAECCATLFGGSPVRADRTEQVRSSFPHTLHWVKVQLSKLY